MSQLEELKTKSEALKEQTEVLETQPESKPARLISSKRALEMVHQQYVMTLMQLKTLQDENEKIRKDNDRLWRLIESHYAE